LQEQTSPFLYYQEHILKFNLFCKESITASWTGHLSY